MKIPPLQPRTRLAHAAAKWAEDKGRFGLFNSSIFKAFFQDGRDIGKLEILMQIAGEVGLDSDELESEVQKGSYIAKVLEDEELARQVNVRAVPAYASGARVLAAGVQSLVQLQRFIPLL